MRCLPERMDTCTLKRANGRMRTRNDHPTTREAPGSAFKGKLLTEPHLQTGPLPPVCALAGQTRLQPP